MAAFGDDGDDLRLALARKIVSGEEEDEADTVEAVFAEVRDAGVAAEELLVDDGWKTVEVEPGPATVRVNGNRIGGTGADAELVAGANGHAANRAGRCDVETDGSGSIEGQRSLFSWAEFLEEPDGKRQNGRPRPASASLFQWALSLQQAEVEPTSAGR